MARPDRPADRPRPRTRAWAVLRAFVTAAPPLAVWLLALAGDVAESVLQAGFVLLAAAWFAALAVILRHDQARTDPPGT